MKVLPVKINRERIVCPKEDKLHLVNNNLAKAQVKAFGEVVSIRKFRRNIIKLSETEYKEKMQSEYPISLNDIKRLEYPRKCQIPLNLGDILTVIIGELRKYKDSYENTDVMRNEPDCIVDYLIPITIQAIDYLSNVIEFDQTITEERRAQYQELLTIVNGVLQELRLEYNYSFSSIF